MATISVEITVPDAAVNTIVNAFATANGWSPDLGLTKAAYSQKVIKDYFWTIVKRQLSGEAAGVAKLAKEVEIDALIT